MHKVNERFHMMMIINHSNIYGSIEYDISIDDCSSLIEQTHSDVIRELRHHDGGCGQTRADPRADVACGYM